MHIQLKLSRSVPKSGQASQVYPLEFRQAGALNGWGSPFGYSVSSSPCKLWRFCLAAPLYFTIKATLFALCIMSETLATFMFLCNFCIISLSALTINLDKHGHQCHAAQPETFCILGTASVKRPSL